MNLCEQTHKTLWSALQAIRVNSNLDTWKSAIAKATLAHNATVHLRMGFTPHLLHMGQEVSSPGFMPPETGSYSLLVPGKEEL